MLLFSSALAAPSFPFFFQAYIMIANPLTRTNSYLIEGLVGT
jgi:hypothetical protein